MRSGTLYMEGQPNLGGLYVIINILDCGAYIGKSNNLYRRQSTHNNDLEHGIDSRKLQHVYNEGAQLADFPLEFQVLGNTSDPQLLDYEKAFMYAVLESGFELYNSEQSPSRKRLTKQALLRNQHSFRTENDLQSAMDLFDTVIKERFGGKTMKELVNLSRSDREKIWEGYLHNPDRLKRKIGHFYKNDMSDLFGMEKINIRDINPEKLVFTKAGAYLGQGILEIMECESREINKRGYALWTLANLNAEATRRFCANKDQTVYALIQYTASHNNRGSMPHVFKFFSETMFSGRMPCLTEEEILSIYPNGILLDERGRHLIPPVEDTPVTGSSKASQALIIDKFFCVTEHFALQDFLPFYFSVDKNGNMKEAADSIQGINSTICLQRKDSHDLKDLHILGNGETTDYILARLKAPYIIDLEK